MHAPSILLHRQIATVVASDHPYNLAPVRVASPVRATSYRAPSDPDDTCRRHDDANAHPECRTCWPRGYDPERRPMGTREWLRAATPAQRRADYHNAD